ncbi:MAG: DUF4956 domain-containing protein [Clostridiales bacterium]|nr:DUF4956 domain-containing protein [Clostridiales bacterium]
MLQNIFNGLFDTSLTNVISVGNFLLCIIVSILIGLFLSAIYVASGHRNKRNSGSKSFLVTLAILPAAVCVVIMLVNGNIGAGVAVAGAFSLVRFRSAAGTAREIGAIFIAMSAGLITGMGYLAYAVLFSVIIGLFMFLLCFIGKSGVTRELMIVIPEDLNFNGIFDDLFEKYTAENRLMSIKTSNMGSLFKLKYSITMMDDSAEKEFIDELRCRNGNLEIMICDREENVNEL